MSERDTHQDVQKAYTEALALYNTLRHIRNKVLAEQERNANELVNQGVDLIKKSVSCTLEYLSIVDEHRLQAVSEIKGKCRVLGAIRVNQRIRLIDNMALYR